MFFPIKALASLCISLEAIQAQDILDRCSSAATPAQGSRSCLIQRDQLKRIHGPSDHAIEADPSSKEANKDHVAKSEGKAEKEKSENEAPALGKRGTGNTTAKMSEKVAENASSKVNTTTSEKSTANATSKAAEDEQKMVEKEAENATAKMNSISKENATMKKNSTSKVADKKDTKANSTEKVESVSKSKDADKSKEVADKKDTKANSTDKVESVSKLKAAGKSKEEQKANKKADKKDLPDDLRELGQKLLGGATQLDKFISETEFIQANVVDVKMSLRVRKGDNAAARLPEEGQTDEYGIDQLLESATPHGMINIVDMGGNLGAVSIALFHKYPKYMRAVIAEPGPMTYLLLRWNLWKNGVPSLTEEEISQKGPDRKPGVYAINSGVSETGKDMHFCWAPSNSMNAAICNCSQPPFANSQCLEVHTIKTKKMVGYFGEDGVDLLKMDCEGCELDALPVLTSNGTVADKRIRRLVGELHEVPPEIEDMACKFNHQNWMTKVCSHPIGAGKPLECNPKTRNKDCYKPVPWQRASATA